MTGISQTKPGVPENPYQAPRQSGSASSIKYASRLAAAWAGARAGARATAKWTLAICGGLIALRWLISVGCEAYHWCTVDLGVEELLWSALQQIFFLFASIGTLMFFALVLGFVGALFGGVWHALRWQRE